MQSVSSLDRHRRLIVEFFLDGRRLVPPSPIRWLVSLSSLVMSTASSDASHPVGVSPISFLVRCRLEVNVLIRMIAISVLSVAIEAKGVSPTMHSKTEAYGASGGVCGLMGRPCSILFFLGV